MEQVDRWHCHRSQAFVPSYSGSQSVNQFANQAVAQAASQAVGHYPIAPALQDCQLDVVSASQPLNQTLRHCL